MRGTALALALAFLLIPASPAQTTTGLDLSQMNLEDLLNVKVTSVSKKEQPLSRAAAAVFVIQQEDIRRSGATNIPDLLRIAPGVNVEQIDANAWAISIRGFNTRYSNKVLVLIDGRSVYSPLFSGVYWDQLDVPLEDIDRIEVIRGPGGTTWGANAVNGIISIITKSSKDTTGGLVTAAVGSQVKALGQVQYGGEMGKSGTYRIFAKYFDIGNSARADGSSANDNWNRVHGGFRTDWNPTDSDSVMVQGDLFSNQFNQTVRPGLVATPFDILSNQRGASAGGDILARWNHTLANKSQTSLTGYYDTHRRHDYGGPDRTRTLNLDFQHHLAVGERHDVVWGLGYRIYNTTIPPGYFVNLSPPSRTDSLFSMFLQDEIRLSESVSVTLGWKLEHNAYSRFEHEPNARVVWNKPGSRQTVWAAASRAIRQPSRGDSDLDTVLATIPIGPDTVQVLRVVGNPRLKAEKVWAYEIGHRLALSKRISFDVATFLAFYHDLDTAEPGSPEFIPGSPQQIVVPFKFENKGGATTYGVEASVNWNATSRWRISPGYSYLHATVRQDATSQGIPTVAIATDFPQNTFQVRSLLNLTRKMDFNQSLYYTARLPGGTISGHARLDLSLTRRVNESMELSLVGQNLLRSRSFEYGDALAVVGTQVVRRVYGKITWKF